MNKKALSPLAATVILLVFGLFLGIVVMSLQSAMITKIGEEKAETFGALVCFDPALMHEQPLKSLQLEFLKGEITKEEYIAKQKQILNK